MPVDAHQSSVPMRRFLIVHGKGSGGRKWMDAEASIRAFFRKHDCECVFLTLDRKRQTISDLCLDDHIRAFQPTAIIAAGGDGTLRCVAQYVYHHCPELPIGFLPLGSCNLAAHVIGIPNRLTQALQHLLHAEQESITVGILNGKHVFLISACFGRLAKITVDAEAFHKRAIGFWAYVLSGIWHCFQFPKRLLRYRTDADTEERRHVAHSSLVFLRRSAYALIPPLQRSGAALHAYHFHNATIIGLVSVFFSAYVRQRLSRLTSHVSGSRMELQGKFHGEVHVDGDTIEEPDGSYSITTGERELLFLCGVKAKPA